MARREDLKQVLLRIPNDVKMFLQEQADHNCGSVNSEIVRAVRARMEARQQHVKGEQA